MHKKYLICDPNLYCVKNKINIVARWKLCNKFANAEINLKIVWKKNHSIIVQWKTILSLEISEASSISSKEAWMYVCVCVCVCVWKENIVRVRKRGVCVWVLVEVIAYNNNFTKWHNRIESSLLCFTEPWETAIFSFFCHPLSPSKREREIVN